MSDDTAHRLDSFASAVTRIGTALDQRETYFVSDRGPLSPLEAEILFRNNDLAAAICTVPPEEAMATPPELTGDEKHVEDLNTRLRDLHAWERITNAAIFGRCYGDSFLYMVVADGAKDESEPLNLARVSELRFLREVERPRVSPLTYYNDPAEENHGTPETYSITWSRGGSAIVHETRLLRFSGARTSEQDVVRNNSFYHSVLQRPYEILRDFGITWAAAALMVARSAQAVYKLTGLSDMLASSSVEGREALQRRIELIDSQRGSTRPLILDSDESFEYQTAPLTSLPEVLDRFVHRLSAASGGIPATKLFGMSPGGLGNNGESDQRNWNRILDTYRMTRLDEPVRTLIQVLCAEAGLPLDAIGVSWPDLGQATAAEEAARRQAVIAGDTALITAQVLSPEQVARARFVRENGFDSEIELTEEDISLEVDVEMPEPETEPEAKPEAE